MTTPNLQLTDVSATAGGGCACCATPAAPATGHAAAPSQLHPSRDDVVDASFGVAGMTCGHCVGTVSEAVRALDGVTGVDVTLVAGGTSTLTVTSSGPLDGDAVAAAVREAGYEPVGR